MLISKNHLKTRWTASKDKTRPLLTTIQLRAEGDEVIAVATDGYILSEVRETTPASDEHPTSSGEMMAVTEAHILATSAATIAAAIKKKQALPVLNYAYVGSTGITVTNLEQTQEFKDAPVEGDYPDYEKLIPAADQAKACVIVDPAKLEQLLKVFKGEYAVTLEIHGSHEPVVLRSNQAEHKTTGVLMPLKG